MKSIILFLAITLLMSTGALSAPELTDAEAKQLIEERAYSGSIMLSLGPLAVKYQDIDKVILNIPYPYGVYQLYKAYEKVGVIIAQEDECIQDYIAKRPHSCFALRSCCDVHTNQDGTLWYSVGKINVQKTSKGEELARKGGLPQQADSLVIKAVTLRVDKIVKNEARRKGTDDYRLIMVTIKVQYTPEFKQASEILGDTLSEDRKGIHLFRFDPFKSEWVWIASDVADLNEEFKTNNVSKKLSE